MAFSVSKSRPFRSLGLYKSNGKHAAPKGSVPEPRPAADASHSHRPAHAAADASYSHRPAHAATLPRLTGPHADTKQNDADQRAA
jgi:hypothetical protein